MEERMLQKEQVIDLYKSLEQFLRSEDFGEDVKKVLQKSHPKYLEVLEKRRNDMQRSDHAIVIAGMRVYCPAKILLFLVSSTSIERVFILNFYICTSFNDFFIFTRIQ